MTGPPDVSFAAAVSQLAAVRAREIQVLSVAAFVLKEAPETLASYAASGDEADEAFLAELRETLRLAKLVVGTYCRDAERLAVADARRFLFDALDATRVPGRGPNPDSDKT